MGTHIYYCEVARTREDIEAGVYSVVSDSAHNRHWYPSLNRLITVSERVWKQGPKGGVKIIKERFWSTNHYGHRYQTTNPKAMKEFAWIKLKSKPLSV